MAASMDEVEVIIIKPDKMTHNWYGTFKLCLMIIVIFALYTYLHLFIKAFILKSKQLDRIEMLTIKSDKMMEHIFVVDKNMSISLEELSKLPY